MTGSGTVANITFHVAGARGQGTPLDIESALLNEGTPLVSIDDGRFVVPVEIGGKILYYRDSVTATEPSLKPVDGATVDLGLWDTVYGTLSTVDTDTTDCTADYLFTSITPIEQYWVTPSKNGDFQSAVDPYDAALNAQHVVGLITLSANQMLAADVSGNGSLTSYDSAKIAQFAVALITRLPVGVTYGRDWAFVPAPASEPNLQVSNPTVYSPGRILYDPFIIESAEDQDFHAILFGDVSGNWASACAPLAPESLSLPAGESLAAEAAETSSDAAAGTPGLITPPSLKAAPGETIRVPILAEGASQAISFYLDLRYDPAGRDPVAHLHVDAKDAPRDGRADPVGVAGLDRSDPEEGRGDGPALDLGDGHRDRRQGAGPERDPDEEDEERPHDGEEGHRAAANGKQAHRDLRIPRR